MCVGRYQNRIEERSYCNICNITVALCYAYSGAVLYYTAHTIRTICSSAFVGNKMWCGPTAKLNVSMLFL